MLPRNFVTESEKRRRQIDTLKIFNDNVIEVMENSDYKVEFVIGNTKMTLEIILSAEFPNEKPILLIHPKVMHPWITENTNNIVGAPGLLNYTVHSDLGRVVQAIIRELQLTLYQPVTYSSPINPEMEQFNSQANSNSVTLLTQSTHWTIPELESLTVDELQLMLESSDHLDKFIENLPSSTEMEKSLAELMDQIEVLANANLSKETQLQSLKSGILDRIEQIDKLKTSYENLNNIHKKCSQAYSPHTIMESLKASAVQADEEAERLASDFLNGQIDPETFIKSFAEKRGLGLSRRAREERLAHQLHQLNKALNY